jgi:hypothetical protein
MRLSTPGAILVAGAMVLAGFVIHAAFPRYELRALPDGSLVRIDRWTATSRTADSSDVPRWAATAAGSPRSGRLSVLGIVETGLLVGAAVGLVGWRARRAVRVARVRRRLDHLVAADTRLQRA